MLERALKARGTLTTGEKIDGWLYAENPLGTYIALDSAGTNVRFIPRDLIAGIVYDHQAPKAEFAVISKTSQLEQLQKAVGDSLDRILSRVDYNRVRRLAVSFRETAYALIRMQAEYPRFERSEIVRQVLEARRAYVDLTDELESVGMAELLVRDRELIRAVLSRDTLPQLDAILMQHHELEPAIQLARESDHLGETQLGRTLLPRITEERLILAMAEQDRPEEPLKESEGRSQKGLKVVAASGKIAVGGALAAANVTLGLFAGVFSAIPTLGLGTVAAAVGIPASCYTGLNSACDGLKDLATALESRPSHSRDKQKKLAIRKERVRF